MASPSSGPNDQQLHGLLRLTSAIFGIGIIIQAALASFGLWGGRGENWIDYHQYWGMTLLAVVIIQAGLAIVAGQRGIVPRSVVLMSVALVILVVVQLGLGFSTRDSAEAIAWHIPLGVGLAALTVANEMTITFAPRLKDK